MSTVRRVAVPALITLALTLLRLLGELQGWDARSFSTAAGGGGAIVGIGWLIPVFGAWFGWRLARAGHGPRSPGRALGMAFLGCGMISAAFALVKLTMEPTPWAMAVGAAGSLGGAWVAFRGWPALGRIDLAYALAARAPILLLTVIAVSQGWGTHYEKLAPDAGQLGPAARTLVLCLAQLVFWVPITVLGGALAGSSAAWFARRAVPAS